MPRSLTEVQSSSLTVNVRGTHRAKSAGPSPLREPCGRTMVFGPLAVKCCCPALDPSSKLAATLLECRPRTADCRLLAMSKTGHLQGLTGRRRWTRRQAREFRSRTAARRQRVVAEHSGEQLLLARSSMTFSVFTSHEPVDQHRPGLADAVCTVNSLRLGGRSSTRDRAGSSSPPPAD